MKNLNIKQLRAIIVEALNTDKNFDEVLRVWPGADVSIIDHIIYFDSWMGYEDAGGLLVFMGIDGSTQIVEWQSDPFSSDDDHGFDPREVTADEAQERISEMNDMILSTSESTSD